MGDLYTLPDDDPRQSDLQQVMNLYDGPQRELGNGDRTGAQSSYGMPEIKPRPGTVTLYRMYNPNVKDHFYTTSFSEYSTVAVDYGYKQEGKIGYIYKSDIEDTVTLYRMYSMIAKDHFYTSSRNEYSTIAMDYGYKQEGSIGYIYILVAHP